MWFLETNPEGHTLSDGFMVLPKKKKEEEEVNLKYKILYREIYFSKFHRFKVSKTFRSG